MLDKDGKVSVFGGLLCLLFVFVFIFFFVFQFFLLLLLFFTEPFTS